MADVFDDEAKTEPTISIGDCLKAVEEEELEADLVLGGDDGKECTYSKGYMKRQAIFSCLTCTPDGNAGVCTACSLSCHDGHEIVELWTKRNFRCDCGNSKFGEFFCKLLANKDVENSGNLYNHNFKGTYCTCDLPYPDPNTEAQLLMIQCCICEDWFHEEHIGLQSSDMIPRELLYEDFICQGCAVVCSFLTYYPQTLLAPDLSKFEKEKAVLENALAVITLGKLETGSCSLNLNNANANGVSVAANAEGAIEECTKDSGSNTKCILVTDLIGNPPTSNSGKPMFLFRNWREIICKCEKCASYYAQKGVGFLLDQEDSIAEDFGTIMAHLSAKTQAAIQAGRAVRTQLEELQSLSLAKILELEQALVAKDAEITAQKVEIEAATNVGRTLGIQEYRASAEFSSDLQHAIEAYKKSDEGLDWVNKRAVDYLEIGFARSILQLEASGILPPEADLSFLSLSREMPGELVAVTTKAAPSDTAIKTIPSN